VSLVPKGVDRINPDLPADTEITGHDGVPVVISARGGTAPKPPADVAIGSVVVKGNASFTNILAGYPIFDTPQNPDAQIGAVKVTGNWTAGNIVPGVAPGVDNIFGTDGDISIPTSDDTAIISKIASIIIGGTVNGTAASGDGFGFVAEHIVSVKICGVTIALDARPSNDTTPVSVGAATGDVNVLEVL
jgi:hypothetical protein